MRSCELRCHLQRCHGLSAHAPSRMLLLWLPVSTEARRTHSKVAVRKVSGRKSPRPSMFTFLSSKGPRLVANVTTCRMARSQTLRLWSPRRKSDTPKTPVAPSLQSSNSPTRRSFVPPASKTSLSSPRTWPIICLHLPTRDTRPLRHPTLRIKSLSNSGTLQYASIANREFWSGCGRPAMPRRRTTWGG